MAADQMKKKIPFYENNTIFVNWMQESSKRRVWNQVFETENVRFSVERVLMQLRPIEITIPESFTRSCKNKLTISSNVMR